MIKGGSLQGVVVVLPTDKEDGLQEVVADRGPSEGEATDLADHKEEVSEEMMVYFVEEMWHTSQEVVTDLQTNKESCSQWVGMKK